MATTTATKKTTTKKKKFVSPYRKAEAEFVGRPDEFLEYLSEHRYDHPTLCIGWAVEQAKQKLNLDQVQIAARTEVRDKDGNLVEPGYTKSYISALLSWRSTASPAAYLRLARACEVNVLEFHIAEKWIPIEYIAAYNLPERELVLPILAEIGKLPREMQPSARAVVISVLQTLVAQYAEQKSGTKAETTPRKIGRPSRR